MTKQDKRALKEGQIIDAAEKVFTKKGFEGTKMEDVAKEIGMSKGSIYFYFNSKENLYLAIVYRAHEKLIDIFQRRRQEIISESGLYRSIAMFKSFIDFSASHPLYSMALLDFFTITSDAGKTANEINNKESLESSLYFAKIKSIQSIPAKLVISCMVDGAKDGSVREDVNPVFLYLTAWSTILGFRRITDSPVVEKNNSIMHLSIDDWKRQMLFYAAELLGNKSHPDYTRVFE